MSVPSSPELGSSTSASASASSPSPSASSSDVGSPKVRFEEACVLIPDPAPISRLPRLVTKSYSLPLWRRKSGSASALSDSEADDDHVVFKVAVPSFTIKSRSHSRDPSEPLVSCLLNGDPSSPVAHHQPGLHRRRASSPIALRQDLVTVPLRPCCPQCFHSTDICLKEGEQWEVRFSRGATRRRRATISETAPRPSHRCVRDMTPGFDAVVVDEVGLRRRPAEKDVLSGFAPLRRAHSLESVMPGHAVPHTLKTISPAPAIPEEDEAATPRRTPAASPRASTSSLVPSLPIAVPPAPPLFTDIPHLGLALPSTTLTDSPPALSASPIPTPPTEPPPSTPTRTHTKHQSHGSYFDHPTYESSPESSPTPAFARPKLARLDSVETPHARSPSTESPWRRHFTQAPASLFRASAQVLRGVSAMSGNVAISA